MTLLDHLAHGAHHLPLSGHLLRLAVIATALTVTVFTDATWLTVMAAAIAALIAAVSGLEMHEAAEDCHARPDDEARVGRAA